MVDFDTADFARLNFDIANANSFQGNMPSWLEEALRKTKKESEREEQALEKLLVDQSPEQQDKRRYEERIKALFDDFDRNLPKDYLTYGNPELTKPFESTKNNIRQLADDMHKLSELAGGDPKLEQQSEKITANLLDRLKNDLGLSPDERKQLEGKSLEEIQEYYTRTRSDKLDKLNETVNGYRQELHYLIEQTAGKSPEEKAKIFQNELKDIELQTGQNREKAKIVISMVGVQYESVTINDVKAPAMDSRTVSEQDLAKKQREKANAEAAI